MPSVLRSEERISDGHLTQIQQVREEKRLVHRAPEVTSVILSNINPRRIRPGRHVWPERHVMLAFKHCNVNFLSPS